MQPESSVEVYTNVFIDEGKLLSCTFFCRSCFTVWAGRVDAVRKKLLAGQDIDGQHSVSQCHYIIIVAGLNFCNN